MEYPSSDRSVESWAKTRYSADSGVVEDSFYGPRASPEVMVDVHEFRGLGSRRKVLTGGSIVEVTRPFFEVNMKI
jgi:hypothetical protein